MPPSNTVVGKCARRLYRQERVATTGAHSHPAADHVAVLLQGLLEIAEDTGMGEALRAAGLDVDKLKREAQEKLVSRNLSALFNMRLDGKFLARLCMLVQGQAAGAQLIG